MSRSDHHHAASPARGIFLFIVLAWLVATRVDSQLDAAGDENDASGHGEDPKPVHIVSDGKSGSITEGKANKKRFDFKDFKTEAETAMNERRFNDAFNRYRIIMERLPIHMPTDDEKREMARRWREAAKESNDLIFQIYALRHSIKLFPQDESSRLHRDEIELLRKRLLADAGTWKQQARATSAEEGRRQFLTEAVQILEKYVKLFPNELNRRRVLREATQLSLETGDPALAGRLFRDFIRIYPDDVGIPDMILRAAEMAYAEPNYTISQNCWAEFVKRYRNNRIETGNAMMQLGDFCFKAKCYDRAKFHYRAIQRWTWDIANLVSKLGKREHEIKEILNGIDRLRIIAVEKIGECLEKEAEERIPEEDPGKLLKEAADHFKGLLEQEKGITKERRVAWTLRMLRNRFRAAMSYLGSPEALSEFAAGIAPAEKFLRLNKTSGLVNEIRYYLGMAHFELGRRHEAIGLLGRILENSDEEWGPWAYQAGRKLALDFYSQGRLIDALAMFRHLQTITPEKDAFARLSLACRQGRCYEQLRHLGKAAELFESVVVEGEQKAADFESTGGLTGLVEMARWHRNFLSWKKEIDKESRQVVETPWDPFSDPPKNGRQTVAR